jgi:hypothetical protein
MNLDAVLAHLYGLRAQLNALILSVELEQTSASLAGGCQHPVEKRKDASTMGSTKWQCMVCGEEFDGHA